MGAWGHGVFDNDTACDWSYSLEECTDLSLIKESLAAVVDPGDEYLDSDPACEALAACDAIARLRGKFGVRNSYTETVDNWAGAHSTLDAAPLLGLAHQVIDRITSDKSELFELWKESDEFDEWLASIEELRSRLA